MLTLSRLVQARVSAWYKFGFWLRLGLGLTWEGKGRGHGSGRGRGLLGDVRRGKSAGIRWAYHLAPPRGSTLGSLNGWPWGILPHLEVKPGKFERLAGPRCAGSCRAAFLPHLEVPRRGSLNGGPSGWAVGAGSCIPEGWTAGRCRGQRLAALTCGIWVNA